MVLRAVKRFGPKTPGPCDMIEACPLCDGELEMVYRRPHQQVCACVECQTTITVPVVAWDIARVKKKQEIRRR
jgi:hypothetical protein